MTPEERIDAALDSVLKASGSALKNYTMPLTLDRMREAMRKVIGDSAAQYWIERFLWRCDVICQLDYLNG